MIYYLTSLTFLLSHLLTLSQMKILLIILALLAFSCLIMAIALWRSSHAPGSEIGNMDEGLAKIALFAFLGIGAVIFGILHFRK